MKSPRTPRGVSFPSHVHDSIQIGRDNPAGVADLRNRGPCAKCGRNVYSDQGRGKHMGGLYYHAECVDPAKGQNTIGCATPRAGSSGSQMPRWAEPLRVYKRCGFSSRLSVLYGCARARTCVCALDCSSASCFRNCLNYNDEITATRISST